MRRAYTLFLTLLALGATVTYAVTCVDKGTPQYCQDHKDLCDDPLGADTKYYCKKTCGLCKDVTSSPSGNDCFDKGSVVYCSENEEMCDDPFASDVRFYCRKTCGLCKDPNVIYTTKKPMLVTVKTTAETICVDENGTESCQEKKYLCTNQLFPEYKDNCRKTCGLCIDPNSPTTTTPVCEDTASDCLKRKQTCNNIFTDTKIFCRKTCGLC